ncbi:MAG: Tol-Pal system beta propeller repeat protein TolB [Deltaproteobacteria bacterium]|nr:Tol-Pal system beta propeller repeat protein TolB [Deltaproteobacteria bacterium]
MKKITLFFVLFFSIAGSAHARIYVPIDQPSDKKLPIAITNLVGLDGGAGKFEKDIPEVIQKDLENSAYFQFIPPGAFLEDGESRAITLETIPFDLWSAIEAQGLIKGGISRKGDKLTVELRLFDPFLKQLLVGKKYVGSVKDYRSIAHRFADEVMLAMTGAKGPFNSKITYTAITGGGRKAIYVMDYDGENNYRITDTKTISLGSKFSPDGSRIAFTSYKSGTPEIHMANLGGGEMKQLTHNKQTNLTPAFSPDGGTIIFSSSVAGDPDIWIMNLAGKMIKQITHTMGVDISPVYSPDGSRVLFSSERAGRLHVFTMNPDGSDNTRLTFVGQFNDTPTWSPDGQKLTFCGRDSGAFDIFTMNVDGSLIQRLTAGEGNNEHPSWSPDSRYITFSSTRSGGPVIYMMRFDGANPVRLSQGNGLLPWWGPNLK